MNCCKITLVMKMKENVLIDKSIKFAARIVKLPNSLPCLKGGGPPKVVEGYTKHIIISKKLNYNIKSKHKEQTDENCRLPEYLITRLT